MSVSELPPKPAILAVFNEVLSQLWRPKRPSLAWGDLISLRINRPDRCTPLVLVDLLSMPETVDFAYQVQDDVVECLVSYQASVFKHHAQKRCPDQQASASWKNFSEVTYQHVFSDILARFLIPMVYQAGKPTFESMGVDVQVLHGAVVDIKDEYAYVDVSVPHAGTTMLKCVPSESAGCQRIRSTSMPCLVLTNNKTVSIRSRRGFLQKHAEGCCLGVVVNTLQSVVNEPLSPVLWCPDLEIAHCEDMDPTETSMRMTDLFRCSHHGLDDANATTNPAASGEVQRRLDRLAAIGSRVVNSGVNVELILSHAHGGGIESAFRALALVCVVMRQDGTTLKHLIDLLDDLCGVTAYTHAKSLTPRNQSRINFFLWWRLLRWIFEERIVVCADDVPGEISSHLAAIIAEFPDNSMEVRSQSRQKQDHHAHLVYSLRLMSQLNIRLTLQTDVAIPHVTSSMGIMDIVDAIVDLIRAYGKCFLHGVDTTIEWLKLQPTWSAFYTEACGEEMVRLLIVYEMWRMWSLHVRNDILKKGAMRHAVMVSTSVIESHGVLWTSAVWAEMLLISESHKHPLLQLVTWANQQLGFGHACADIRLRLTFANVSSVIGGTQLSVYIMKDTTNVILSPDVLDSTLTKFCKLDMTVTALAISVDCPVWLNMQGIAAWPDNHTDLNAYFENSILKQSKLTGTPLCAPDLQSNHCYWKTTPSWMLENLVGMLPLEAPFTLRTTKRPMRYSMPKWLFCPGMSWTWLEITKSSVVALTAVPIPSVQNNAILLTIVYLVRPNCGNEGKMFVRPLCDLSEVQSPVEQWVRNEFLSTKTVPVTRASKEGTDCEQFGPWASKMAAYGGCNDIDIEANLLNQSGQDCVYSVLERLSKLVSNFGVDESLITESVTVVSELFSTVFGLFAYDQRLLTRYSSSTRYQDVCRIRKIGRLNIVNAKLLAEKREAEKVLDRITGEFKAIQDSYDTAVSALCSAETPQLQSVMGIVTQKRRQKRDEWSEFIELFSSDTQAKQGELVVNSSQLSKLQAQESP